MRLLIPILVLLSLAAACGGGASPHSTTTPPPTATRVPAATPGPTEHAVLPFNPAEEVLTPPPDIDTSAWLTYRDEEQGFELKYPPGAAVERDAQAPLGVPRVGVLIALPVNVGTTLEKKIFFVANSATATDVCRSKQALSARTLRRLRIANAAGQVIFWSTLDNGRGGAQEWVDTEYFSDDHGPCVSLMTVLELGNIGLFPTGTVAARKDDEARVFTAMLSTFRWTR